MSTEFYNVNIVDGPGKLDLIFLLAHYGCEYGNEPLWTSNCKFKLAGQYESENNPRPAEWIITGLTGIEHNGTSGQYFTIKGEMLPPGEDYRLKDNRVIFQGLYDTGRRRGQIVVMM